MTRRPDAAPGGCSRRRASAPSLPPRPPSPPRDQQSLIEDENLMLELGPGDRRRRRSTRRKALGADVIRANVIWARLAPLANAEEAQGLRRQNPTAYPAALWDCSTTSCAARGRRGLG